MVDVDDPSATTDVGLALTVDFVALTGPANVAVAAKVLFPFAPAVHVLMPVHPPAPLQPMNVDPEFAVAVRITLLKFPLYV
jgi:hypothetical protein